MVQTDTKQQDIRPESAQAERSITVVPKHNTGNGNNRGNTSGAEWKIQYKRGEDD